MNAELSITECHCGNCTNEECEFHKSMEEIEVLGSPISKIIRTHTSLKGCMLHPRAMEAVMGDVIEMLEKKSNEYTDQANISGGDDWLHGSANGIDEAISIIRGGGVG